ncbi:MAG: hypothetical protein FWE33_02370 [Defluviitaleaceae bacterium]|nr:hypothetical protein [Defluviitaleaceae bacterium]
MRKIIISFTILLALVALAACGNRNQIHELYFNYVSNQLFNYATHTSDMVSSSREMTASEIDSLFGDVPIDIVQSFVIFGHEQNAFLAMLIGREMIRVVVSDDMPQHPAYDDATTTYVHGIQTKSFVNAHISWGQGYNGAYTVISTFWMDGYSYFVEAETFYPDEAKQLITKVVNSLILNPVDLRGIED